MGIMVVMAMVITRPLGLTTVTAEAIMAVIQLMVDIMAVVIEVVMEGAIMAADLEAFTVVIDKNGNIVE